MWGSTVYVVGTHSLYGNNIDIHVLDYPEVKLSMSKAWCICFLQIFILPPADSKGDSHLFGCLSS